MMDAQAPRDLRDLTIDELRAELEALGEPGWRAKQIFARLYKRDAASIEEFADLLRLNNFHVGQRLPALVPLRPLENRVGPFARRNGIAERRANKEAKVVMPNYRVRS